MSEQLTKPPDWPFLQGEDGALFGVVLMSNSDDYGKVNKAVAERMKHEQGLAEYTGWNFHAECWFADNQYHAAVYRYHIHRATLSANTPEELREAVSEGFGYE